MAAVVPGPVLPFDVARKQVAQRGEALLDLPGSRGRRDGRRAAARRRLHVGCAKGRPGQRDGGVHTGEESERDPALDQDLHGGHAGDRRPGLDDLGQPGEDVVGGGARDEAAAEVDRRDAACLGDRPHGRGRADVRPDLARPLRRRRPGEERGDRRLDPGSRTVDRCVLLALHEGHAHGRGGLHRLPSSRSATAARSSTRNRAGVPAAAAGSERLIRDGIRSSGGEAHRRTCRRRRRSSARDQVPGVNQP